MFKKIVRLILNILVPAGAALLIGAPCAWAVKAQNWDFDSESSYVDGDFNNTLVNSSGELTLSRELKPLMGQSIFSMVSALVVAPDGSIYFGTSPQGKIYKISNGKNSVYYQPPSGQTNVLSLALDKDGSLLAATCGTAARLVRITNTGGTVTATTIFQNAAVDYIWAIRQTVNGNIYLATGPHGQIWQINPQGQASPLMSIDVHNIMSLVIAPDGSLIAGTDGPGLVIRVNSVTGASFVLMAADSAEISALATDAAGNIFAATASPGLAQGSGGLFQPQNHSGGQPASLDGSGGAASGADQGQDDANNADDSNTPDDDTGDAGDQSDQSSSTQPQSDSNSGQDDGNSAANAVYQITPTGRVTVLLHVPDMILSMLYDQGTLMLGMSDHGRLVFYDPATQTRSLVARLTESNILCMAQDANGVLYLGTANQGQIYQLSASNAAGGTYVSKVLDAQLPADWGAAHFQADIPEGADVEIQTRSGNLPDVDTLGKFWSPWSEPMPAIEYRKISSPPARYLQFRLTLQSDKNGQTPVVHPGWISYQQISVPPEIASVQVQPDPDSPHQLTVQWSATDANNDTMEFKLEYQQQGIPVWINLVEHESDSQYSWDTTGLPDGNYQVKVIASNAPDNTPQDTFAVARQTQWFLVNNTPPEITKVQWQALAGRKVQITGIASDKLSPVTAVSFQIDSGKNWQPAAASDTIFDSPLEGFTARTQALDPGSHRVVIRASDSQGNTAYASVLVTVQ
jgi:hypothetical protein